MGSKINSDHIIGALTGISMIFLLLIGYLLYQNALAEDMIRELDQNYEELASELSRDQTGREEK